MGLQRIEFVVVDGKGKVRERELQDGLDQSAQTRGTNDFERLGFGATASHRERGQ